MKLKNIFIAFVIFTFFLTGCTTPVTEEDEKYSFEIPTPTTGKCILIGKLVNATTNEPVGGNPFLARNLSLEDPEMPPTISVSPQNDPSGAYDMETGDFLFTDIEPADNYVIMIIYGPGRSYVVREEGSETPLIINIEAGQTLDLEVIHVREP